MAIEFSLILLGCFLLAFGAEWLVSAAALIAERFRIPKAVAGLTVVALGTSAPELIVNVLSAARGDTDFAMSNVAGSNLANLCLGFGLCAVIGTLPVSLKTFRSDLFWLVLTPGVIVAALLTAPKHVVALPVAGALSVILAIYFVSVVRRSRGAIEGEPREQPIGRALLMLAGGALLLYFGAELVLQMSSKVAETLGISSAIIGLTIVAAGTSIPDIAASVVAHSPFHRVCNPLRSMRNLMGSLKMLKGRACSLILARTTRVAFLCFPHLYPTLLHSWPSGRALLLVQAPF